MISRYANLSEEDVLKLKKHYCVFYKDESVDREETEFILKYRQKLCDAIEYFWKANVSNEHENKRKAIEGIVQVADMIGDYIKSANAGNIRQRLLFLNNIDREVECVNIYIQWMLRKYNSDNALNVVNKEKSISDFLKFVGLSNMKENFNLENLLDENVKLQAHHLKKNLKEQFISYIDINNLTFYDNYFLIGECLNQIDKLDNEMQKIEKTKCGGCMVDDCAINHCVSHANKIEVNKKIKAYEKVVEFCANNLSGKVVAQEDIESLSKIIDDRNITFLLSRISRIPAIETRNDRVKKINLESLTRMPELIDSLKILEVLSQKINLNDNIKYYKNINLIATSLLLTRCDYSKAEGDKIIKNFEAWANQTGNNLESYLPSGLTGELICKYKENKQEKENC